MMMWEAEKELASALGGIPVRTAWSQQQGVVKGVVRKEDLIDLLSAHRKLRQTEEETQSWVQHIDQKLQSFQTYSKKLQTRDLSCLRVKKLREMYKAKEKLCEEERKAVEKKRQRLLPHLRKVSSAEISLLASKKILQEDEKSLKTEQLKCVEIAETLVLKRWKLIAQLRLIFGVVQSPGAHSFSINGFRLPNSDFTGCDEEQIATALGFVAHVTFMISKYLNIPLRYPMVPMCSRSIIRDDISQQVSPKFPLYSRGVDRTRFEYAVFLLNKNLEQLLNSQSLNVVTLRHTLPNLQILLSPNTT